MSYPAIIDKWKCGDKNKVISPYFLTTFALKSLIEGEHHIVKDYILWYIHNLNYPDKYGYTGTIYDFIFKEGKLVSLDDYDSADSYAGTFLVLIYLYILYTKDLDFIRDNLSKIKDISYAIIKLKDTDSGLVRAKPDLNSKFLIDNIEAYTGLALFCKTLKLFKDKEGEYYCKHAVSLKQDIEKGFKEKDKLYWVVDDNVKQG